MEKKDISLNILFKIGKNYNMREVIVSQKKSPVIKVTGIKVVPFALLVLGFFVIVICSSAYYIKNNPVIIERKITVRDTVIMTKEKIKIKREKVYTNLDATINSIKSGMKLKENKSGIATLHGYTPFQIGIYILKAHESFRPGEYPDGQYNSKGFGLNLTPDHVKWATKKLGFPCRSRDWTYEEGVKLLYLYYEDMKNEVKRQNPGINEFQLVALLLHKYNTGNTKTIHACCGAKKGCGSKNKKIRKAHNERRNDETRLFSNKFTKAEIEKYQALAAETDRAWKN